ncbi:MAG: hypothetical protein K2X29_10200 [Candidatus Obscuribacterales bacterium]|nr:hypothetical protein [Candidatus Obscuribacterales bacterium]
MGNKQLYLAIGTAVLLVLLFVEWAFAGTVEIQTKTKSIDDQTGKPSVSHDKILQLGDVSSKSLLIEAQLALRSGRIDRAIDLAKLGLAKDVEEIDLHKVYAEALEEKVSVKNNDVDPALFNECVREWLIVLRNLVGEEKSMSFRGISIPGMEILCQDDDRRIVAKYSLIKLVGRIPKPWETNRKYLERVLKPVPDVQGAILRVSARQ